MRFFSSILAFYMTVLFLTPCADTLEKDELLLGTHSTATSHDHHDHSDPGEMDLCSPFCVCGCCGLISGIVLQEYLPSLTLVTPIELPRVITYYRSTFVPPYLGEIWQPPKMNS